MPDLGNNELDDIQLVEAILLDDHEAFKKLYYKYFKSLIRFAYYRTHSMENSREFVQEIFYKLWINRHSLNPEKSIKAYLYKSLSNFIINQANLHSSKNISIEDLKKDRVSEEIDLENKIDITEAINALPEKLKAVFILSRIEGFKYQEIAEIYNISEKAVEKRMYQAFEILRNYLLKKF